MVRGRLILGWVVIALPVLAASALALKVVLGDGSSKKAVLLAALGVIGSAVMWVLLRNNGRGLTLLAAMPLTVVAAFMVVLEVASMAKGAVEQYPAYSLARSNFDAVGGKTCGLASDVLVESNVNGFNLQPIIDPANPPSDPLAGANPIGFSPNGVPEKLDADAVEVKPGTGNTATQTVGPAFEEGQNAGTGGGFGAEGVNGSTVKLPFGLDPATTPVMGSWQDGVQQPAELTSSWYELPARSADKPLIVFSIAGRVMSFDQVGNMTYGQDLFLQYGKRTPDGTVDFLGQYRPLDVGPFPSWRNARVPVDQIPADADAVRIYARDPILIGDQWLAVTPPRMPVLQSLDSYIGHTQPVLLDWAVGLQFPCQQPFLHNDGVAQAPNYRILPDRPLATSSTNTWQAQENGGPLGLSEMLASSQTIPTYLKNDWARDWGSLEKYTQYYSDAKPAQLQTSTQTRSGWWTPGKMRVF
ncbi:arabinosyltransferase C-terminal domain-containing protein [Nocardia sp. 2]|uniref:Arabinosyltransferase C-terminal domain-containing protein n=2 Tax=Nocardia acididurans TaxID=2802282 RepID=A0ABS1LY90_9NOCA|nr:arabinosyltransferase C-terminal domain-containing protein [Nocardia acididurans]